MTIAPTIRAGGMLAPVELVEKYETDLGVVFPESYKAFISNNNTAYPEKSCFDYWDDYLKEEGEKSIYFFVFGPEQSRVNASEDLLRFQDFDIYGHDHVVAFAGTAEGDYVCFDYRHNPETLEPKISVMAHDMHYKETRKMVINHVANSFSEFCQLLRDDTDI